MSPPYSFTIVTDPGELDRIAATVEEIGEKEHWSPELIFRVHLALEELGLNVINYGHDDGLHEIQFTVTSQAEQVTIEMTDDGRPFDPLNDAPPPDLSSSLEDRRIGGQGVHLVRTLMDQVQYERISGKNHITLVSRRVG